MSEKEVLHLRGDGEKDKCILCGRDDATPYTFVVDYYTNRALPEYKPCSKQIDWLLFSHLYDIHYTTDSVAMGYGAAPYCLSHDPESKKFVINLGQSYPAGIAWNGTFALTIEKAHTTCEECLKKIQTPPLERQNG